MLSNYKIEIKWAFIFIGTLLFWSLLERVFGFHDEHLDKYESFSMLFMIPAILVYVLALKDKKKNFLNGQMSYKQGLISGFIISVIVAVFNPLTQFIISELTTPNYFDNLIDFTVKGGHDTLEEAQAYFNYKNYAIQGTIFAFAMGVFTTLCHGRFSSEQKINENIQIKIRIRNNIIPYSHFRIDTGIYVIPRRSLDRDLVFGRYLFIGLCIFPTSKLHHNIYDYGRRWAKSNMWNFLQPTV